MPIPSLISRRISVPIFSSDTWHSSVHPCTTIVISPFARKGFVDHTQYDTTSILATIEHRYGLAPLTSRDAAVNDLSNVFTAKSPFNT